VYLCRTTMKIASIGISVAFLIVSVFATNTPTPEAPFCGKYTLQVFTVDNSSYQLAFLQSIVDRAVLGSTVSIPAVTGLVHSALNAVYFNGTYSSTYRYVDGAFNPTPYYTDPISGLRIRLVNYFAYVLGCTLYQPYGTYTVPTLYATHNGLGITKAVWTEFLLQFSNSVASFGVSLGNNGPLTEGAFLNAMFGVALRCTGSSCPNMICVGADCDMATDWTTFASGSDGTNRAWSNLLATAANGGQTNSGTVAVNGKVTWRMDVNHNVAQTDGSYNTLSGGFRSGAVDAAVTFTNQFLTRGTYYFHCEQHATMQGVLVVSSSSTLAVSLPVLLAAFALAFHSHLCCFYRQQYY